MTPEELRRLAKKAAAAGHDMIATAWADAAAEIERLESELRCAVTNLESSEIAYASSFERLTRERDEARAEVERLRAEFVPDCRSEDAIGDMARRQDERVRAEALEDAARVADAWRLVTLAKEYAEDIAAAIRALARKPKEGT